MSAVLEQAPSVVTLPELVSAPRAVPVRRSHVLTRDLRASIGDGAFFGVMVGIGETYLAAFVLAVGLGEVLAGLIASVPQLAGGVMQLVTPRAVRWLGSYRRWVILCATLQALSFLPLVAAALVGRIPAAAALMVAAVYWGTGMATGPAWNTWIGTLVPRRVRPRYFARRTRISQAAVLSGFLIGGAILQTGTVVGRPLTAFAVLFLVACACRSASAWCLAQHSEPVPAPRTTRQDSPRAVFARMTQGNGGRLLCYIITMQAAVYISGPYFSPYMLRELRLSYADFVTLTASAFVAKILMLPLFGQFAHRFGARRLLWVGGLGIVPIAALWLVSTSLPWLITAQLISGTVWAAYELATFLLFFESIPEEERTSVLTLFNLANSAALVAGSLVGGAVLKACGAGAEGYALLFLLSSLVRALTVVLLWRVPSQVSESASIAVRLVAVRPGDGSIDRPILSSLNESPAETQAATASDV